MKLLTKTFIALLAAFAALLAGPAMAGAIKADYQQVKQHLESKGYPVELDYYDGDKDPFLTVRIKNFYHYDIYFNGCNAKGANCDSIQFFASFKPRNAPTFEQINTYNLNHRYGRAFLSKDGIPCMRWELPMGRNGMDEADFDENLVLWHSIVKIYGEFIFDEVDASGKT